MSTRDKSKNHNCEKKVLLREAFGEISRLCDGNTYTLIEATATPMENVNAEIGNFGDCSVTFHFLQEKGETVNRTVPANAGIRVVQIPGRILLVSVTCNCPCEAVTECDAGALLTFSQCVCCLPDGHDEYPA